MSVRGSKNKILIYIAGACTLVFAIILYHNASQRLEAMEISYERCHLNEESLSAQLQVNLEYKIRLEKSLQQEKSDHAQTKEEFQKKLEDEKESRDRDNLENINKFSALKEQYNFMQHECDVVQDKYKKLRQLQLSEANDRKNLEEVVEKLKKELNLLKDIKEKDSDNWKDKVSGLEHENLVLQEENRKLREKVETYEKKRTSPSDLKLSNPLGPLFRKNDINDTQIRLPNYPRDGALSPLVKSSTAANKLDKELFPSANSLFANVSTPMINPMAVLGDDKMPIAPMPPQPRQESSSMKEQNVYDVRNENVAPKPEELPRDGPNGMVVVQDVLRAPDLFHHFNHVPEVQNYKKQMRESEKNNHGGEVGDEEEAIQNGKNVVPNHVPHWREGDFREQPMGVNPVANEIPRNQGYQYPVEDEGRKEEGEDDDDMDAIEYQNMNDKPREPKENDMKQVIPMQFNNKHESVMLQPK